ADVQMESVMFMLKKALARPNVLNRSGPSAAGIADPPVFEVERRDARRSQGFAQVSGVREVILRPPKATVDVQQNGMRSLRAGETHFKKLVRVGAIGYTLVGWR